MHSRPLLGLALALAVAVIGMWMSTAAAHAAFGLDGFTAKTATATGAEDTAAGGHPFSASTAISFNTGSDGSFFPDGNVRTIKVDLPAGFVGNPKVAPTCTQRDLQNSACAPATQVGLVALRLVFVGTPVTFTQGVYNTAPRRGDIADFGFVVLGVTIHVGISLRPGDLGVRATIQDVPQVLPVIGTKLTLWGTPADPAHDRQRSSGFECNGDPDDPSCVLPSGTPAGVAPRPLLVNPSSCGPSVTTRVEVNSWEDVKDVHTATAQSSSGGTGCDALAFTPTLDVGVEKMTPDAPSGLTVNIDMPQSDTPQGRGTPPLRDAVVTLPEGMTINPSSPDGLGACTDAQLGLGNDNPNGCPESSKIGTVTAVSPPLTDVLEGGVYLRTQNSDDPQSGEMFRMAIVLDQPETGVRIKLPGAIKVDPASGRIVTEFRDNPQLPVSKLSLKFKTGPRAPLATPTTCGTKTVDAKLTSWGGQTADLHSSFDIDCTAGLGGFAPAFSAGTVQPVGGVFSPFALAVARNDGDQAVNGLSLAMPPGLLAKLAGIPRCSSAAAEAGTCADASRVGSTTVAVGPGATPFYVKDQPVYLTEGYNGGQFGLVAKIRAVAGPFDLGTVIVRQAIHIDPIDAHVTVVSDPLPTILKGIPLRLRRLDVNVDRPGFMVNPTSCAPKAITGKLSSVAGQTAPVSVRFQVGDCASLNLKPNLTLSLSGKGQTTDGKHPAVSAVLNQPQGGQANLKKVRVALPLSLALDPDNSDSDAMCSFTEGSKPDPKCPASSVVGRATAVTPILGQPLSGPVFFVKNERKDPKSGRSIKTTPKLVIPLVGENGLRLTLTGTSDVVDNQLVTTFDNIPDAPVSSFKMDISGGKKGILVVSNADICKSTQVADQRVDGQNNKVANADVYIHTPSCPLKALSTKLGKSSVTVKVGGLSAGKVTVSGRGIKKTTKTISQSTVATITAKRTTGKLGKVKISFLAKGAKKAKTASATVK